MTKPYYTLSDQIFFLLSRLYGAFLVLLLPLVFYGIIKLDTNILLTMIAWGIGALLLRGEMK